MIRFRECELNIVTLNRCPDSQMQLVSAGIAWLLHCSWLRLAFFWAWRTRSLTQATAGKILILAEMVLPRQMLRVPVGEAGRRVVKAYTAAVHTVPIVQLHRNGQGCQANTFHQHRIPVASVKYGKTNAA